MIPLPEPQVPGGCDACRRTGCAHCSDPINCGGMLWAHTTDKVLAYGDARAAAARRQALEEAAQKTDSCGHHWAGAPAHAFFDLAAAIRSLIDKDTA